MSRFVHTESPSLGYPPPTSLHDKDWRVGLVDALERIAAALERPTVLDSATGNLIPCVDVGVKTADEVRKDQSVAAPVPDDPEEDEDKLLPPAFPFDRLEVEEDGSVTVHFTEPLAVMGAFDGTHWHEDWPQPVMTARKITWPFWPERLRGTLEAGVQKTREFVPPQQLQS